MEKLLQKVYRFLSFRDRSEKEIRDYFRIKNSELRIKNKEQISEEMVNQTIDKLKEQGLIDDERFAKEWVLSRRRKYGLRRIKQELTQKGIDKETIEKVFSYQLSAISEKEIAEQALEKKLRAWKNLDEINFKKKALGFLIRKGFEYEVAKVVVDNFLKNK